MLSKRRSFGARKVSPPQPTCMTEDQKATYLKSLRDDRPARPTGSRPLPTKPSVPKLNHDEAATIFQSAQTTQTQDVHSGVTKPSRYSLPYSASLGSMKGRPLVTGPNAHLGGRKITPPEIAYRESTLRQKEKLEAQNLRHALEQMDFEDEEAQIHHAAQLEAADLVWKHRNPESAEQEKTTPYRNPDLVKKRYVICADGSALNRPVNNGGYRSASDSSTETTRDSIEPLRPTKRGSHGPRDEGSENMYGRRRKSSGGRNVSGGSSKGVFRNPEDRIYEEPSQTDMSTRSDHEVNQALRSRTHNSSIRGSRPLPEKPLSIPSKPKTGHGKNEFHSSLPTQPSDTDRRSDTFTRTRVPEEASTARSSILEIRSEEIRAATSMRRSDRSPKLLIPTAVSDKPGRPIVSFDPSWKPAEQSARGSMEVERPSSRSLPGRPFSDNLPPCSLDLKSSNSVPSRGKLADDFTRPDIPVLCLPEDEHVNTVNIKQEPRQPPSISISHSDLPSERPARQGMASGVPPIIIEQGQNSVRPLPSININSENDHVVDATESTKASVAPTSSSESTKSRRIPWLSRQTRTPDIGPSRPASVTCSACALPISGRIVTASGASAKNKARFHPECFTCFHCSTGLECVSFYPEPESSRLERLSLESDAVHTDTTFDADLRFYCHLDYHDLFSPRCASCHTPIEGAVIMAAGKSWHEGHFFCAECGDPFSSSSPFVESQGYAYCVGCHTKRTSARCKACKKQILDEISVEALGGKWHEECFRCDDCGCDFGDEGKFFVREVDVELTEKEKRKGLSYRKVEERAVCGGCEARRLKSKDVAAFL